MKMLVSPNLMLPPQRLSTAPEVALPAPEAPPLTPEAPAPASCPPARGSRPHVRFLSQNRPGPQMGMGHYERQLIRALAAAGAVRDGWRFDIRFSGRAPAGQAAPLLMPGLSGAAFEGYSPSRLARLPWIAARALISLSHRRFQPDLYHSLSLAYPAPLGRPVIYTIHDLPPARFPDEGELPRWAAQAACAARAVLTPSRFAKRELMDLLGINGERIHVIPNGYERDVFHPRVRPADAQTLAALGIPGPFLLYAGGSTRRKNVRALLDAWGLTARQYPDLTLVLAGPAAPLKVLARESRAPRVVVTGYLERDVLPRLLKAATALICPSIYEGFGLPPLEAMATGIPVIGVHAGAVPEVTGDCAVLAPDGSADSLAKAIQALLDDSELAASLRRNGPERAHGFSWAEYARRTLSIYEQVAS